MCIQLAELSGGCFMNGEFAKIMEWIDGNKLRLCNKHNLWLCLVLKMDTSCFPSIVLYHVIPFNSIVNSIWIPLRRGLFKCATQIN